MNNGFTANIYNESCVNSDKLLFKGRPLYLVDTRRTSETYLEINYVLIGLFMADITVV